MFGGRREEQQRAAITRELEPYTNMPVESETEQRLQTLEQDLELSNRHTLTSNDRYQAVACYLSLARNRHILLSTIAGAVTSESGAAELVKDPAQSDMMVRFLRDGFVGVQDGLEKVDTIEGQKGFTFDHSHTDLAVVLSRFNWPSADQMPRSAIIGTVDAADSILAHVMSQFVSIDKSSVVPNDFKIALRRQVEPMRTAIDAKMRSIERATGGLINKVSSTAILASVYDDATAAIEKLDEMTVWTTAPKLYDSRFDLRNPLDENNPNRREFNPSIIAGPVVRVQVARPRPSGKPFEPDVLHTPLPIPQQTPQRQRILDLRPFSADILAIAPSQQRPATTRPVGREFTPDDLARKPADSADTDSGASARHRSKPFNPSDLG